MTKNFSRALLLVCFFTAGGIFSAARAQTVSISVPGGSVSKGKATRATIILDIPGDLHVNSNRPNSEYAIATAITPSASGARVGAVNYPRGKNRKFQWSERLVNVYEGRVTFTFPVTVPANFRGSSLKVNAKVRFQACTDEVCYPPRTRDVSVTARVR